MSRNDLHAVPGGRKGEPARVVVVDDHPIWREAAARTLTEAGYVVVGTAGNGAQALRVVAATRPDVVLLDLNLPECKARRSRGNC